MVGDETSGLYKPAPLGGKLIFIQFASLLFSFSLTSHILLSISSTKALAFEVGHLGVRVNAIAPGSISTPQFNRNLQALTAEKQAAFQTMVKEIYPLQHIGTVEDIAQAAVFLASENASWITGTILAVDGGLTTN